MERNQVEAVGYMMVGLLAAETGQLWEVAAEKPKDEWFVLFTLKQGDFKTTEEYRPYTKADYMIGNVGPYRPNLSEAMYSLRYIARQVVKRRENEQEAVDPPGKSTDCSGASGGTSSNNGSLTERTEGASLHRPE